MRFIEARDLDLASATDEQLVEAWHAYAGQISYHHADDSAKEWGLARALYPTAKKIETMIAERGLPRPTGQYLMGSGTRIEWPEPPMTVAFTDKQIMQLAERFCATPLPETVCADLCATQQGPGRTGTNLMSVSEAKQVLSAVLTAA